MEDSFFELIPFWALPQWLSRVNVIIAFYTIGHYLMLNPTPAKQVNKWLILISVAMGVFLATIDGSIVNIGLNTLVNELHQPLNVVEWVVLAYMLTLSTLMLSVGRLSDMIGKKKLYLAGIIIFTVGSILSGLAPSVYWLIAFRVLQAVGAVLDIAIGIAIVTENFPPAERGKALGVMGTMVSLGIIAGPTIGGLVLQSLSWHWLFFVNIPVGVIGVFMVARFVPEDSARSKQHFDFAGAGSMFISMTSLLFALSISQDRGFNNLLVLVLMLLSLCFLVAFIVIERKSAYPMINLQMFQNRQFTINLITGFMVFVCTAGTTLLFPLYLQNVLLYNSEQTGLMLAITPVIVAIVAPLSGALSDRTGSRPITTLGLFMLILGFLSVGTLSEHTTTIGYLLRFIPIGIGIGLFQSPNNSAVMGSVSRENFGVASGLLSLTRTVGQITGIAVLSAVWENRVALYNGGFIDLGATFAPISTQVAGLLDTIHLSVAILALAFLISAWALVEFLRVKKSLRNSTTE
jgi:EmrB/QacA subfamily drug resistance transporter